MAKLSDLPRWPTRLAAGLLGVCFLFIPPLTAADNIEVKQLKIIRGVESQQRSTDYFHQILAEALALEKGKTEYQLVPVDFEFPQNRTLKLLNLEGVLDITYSMTSPAREQDYIAIKVPLLGGLYGKRRLLVASHKKAQFEQLSIDELKTLVACQGKDWPDYARLKMNGFSVYGADDYEANFKMLAKGRCDYFPRGLAELELDFSKYNNVYGELAIVHNILLAYHAPIYFFVGRHQRDLANTVESGLKKLQESGRIQEVLLLSKAFVYDPNFEKSATLKIAKLK